MQLVGEEGAILLGGFRQHAGAETLVDQHARHGLGVKLQDPAAVRGRPHQHVGHHHLRRHDVPTRARLGVEAFQLGDHVRHIGCIDAAQLHQLPRVAPCQQLEIVEQRLHRRVEPVLLGKLNRQALLEVAGKHPARLEAHHPLADGLDAGDSGAHRHRERLGRHVEPARRLQQRDQIGADQPVRGVVERKPQLRAEMLAQGRGALGDVLDGAIIAFERLAAAAAIRGGGSVRGAAGVVGLGVFGRVERGRTLGGQCLRAKGVGNIGGSGTRGQGELVEGGALADRAVGGFVALQQRVALQLLLDEGGGFEIVELQQLDGLPQLRGHHQRLRLAQVQTGTDRHQAGLGTAFTGRRQRSCRNAARTASGCKQESCWTATMATKIIAAG